MLNPIFFFIMVYGIVVLWQVFRQSNSTIYNITDVKPLNCMVCMSFWIALILSLMFYDDLLIIPAIFGSVGFVYIFKVIEDELIGG